MNKNLSRMFLETKENIGILTFNFPKSLNALSLKTLEELTEILDLVSLNQEIYGLIITGEGKAFVAGADISLMKDYDSEAGRDYAELAQSIFNKIENMEKPIIAAVNGYALGGGCELALSCDIRIASEVAIFGQPEVDLGLIPCFGGTQRLSRLVGTGISKELIYTGRKVLSQEAKEIGLVNKVVPAENLIEESINMMKIIIKKSPLAIKYSKIAINKGMNTDITTGLEIEKDLAGIIFGSEDKKEGISAFLEKREAIFRK